MCGIAGVIGRRGGRPVDAGLLARMNDALAHRGPDGAGVWRSPKRNVGFAHRRLAIVDLSPKAAQPMQDRSGRVCVTFNGEIYNHLALRRELERKGAQFATDHSDTEVLVQGYLTWGIDGLLSRLNGIFAFALSDDQIAKTWLVRDHVGIKPLYVGRLGEEILFASEIKALVVDGAIERRLDPAAVRHYLTFMTAPAPLTLNAGVWKLPAGCLAECGDDGSLEVRRYWDCLPKVRHGGHTTELAAMARALVEQAVERQLMADVPIGIFLSGGVDSAALLALASRRGTVDAFTVGFSDDSEGSEVEAASAIAKHFGARHHVVTVDAAAAQDYLERLVHDQDEPLADWVCVPLHFLAEAAHRNGIKVVLVGEGADEQFCGYPSYRRYLQIARGPWRAARVLGALGLVPPLMRYYARDPHNRGRMMRADFLRRASAGEECFIGGAVVFWDMMKNAIAGPALNDPPPAVPSFANSAAMRAAASGDAVAEIMRPLAGGSADLLARMTYLECKFRLPELLLMRVDKITMADSIEARVPFLDRDIVDFAMTLSEQQKIPGGDLKHVLKQALGGIVPHDVLARGKRGFDAPVAAWLRGPFGRRCRDEVMGSALARDGWLNRGYFQRLFADHVSRAADNAVLIWTVYNLVAWHQHWCRS